MSASLKDNEHIRADQAAFMESFVRAREALGRIDGVAGVGFGHKETAGDFTNDLGITVWVREKKAVDVLSPADRVPATFEGYRTDVRVVPIGELAACDNKTHYPEIKGGIQVESKPTWPKDATAVPEGTLGCIVQRRGDTSRENVYLLSCDHVLRANGAGTGDYVYHPSAIRKGGTSVTDGLGPIHELHKRGNAWSTVPGAPPSTAGGSAGPPFTAGFYVDAAIARINIDSKCMGSTCTKDTIVVQKTKVLDLLLGGVLTDVRSIAMDPSIALPRPSDPLADVINGAPDSLHRVYKVGRTTRRTTGIVRNVLCPATFQENDGDPLTTCENVFEIDFAPKTAEHITWNCMNHKSFAEKGDSGSVVVDDANRVIGLVLLKAKFPAPNDSLRFRSYACHIMPVLEELKICIPTTTGTTWGNAAATDGTGTTPLVRADTMQPERGVVPLSRERSGASARSIPAFEPVPVSDEQQSRMLDLRDAFRETASARELHESFAEVRREVGYLVRNCRPVTVVWHRNRGPAFLACAINHLKGDAETVPGEIGGVTRAALLARMGAVLVAHGSNPLRAAIERHGTLVLRLAESATVQACIDALRREDAVDAAV